MLSGLATESPEQSLRNPAALQGQSLHFWLLSSMYHAAIATWMPQTFFKMLSEDASPAECRDRNFAPLCSLRFKAFAAQPRLAIVTKTLTLAANDLTHFGIVS